MQILIAGEAGQGIAKSAELVSRDLISRGYYVFNYRDYGSLIRGGENFNVIRVESRPVHSNNWTYDYALIFGRFSAHHLDSVARGGISIGTLDGVQAKLSPLAALSKLGAPRIVENSYLLGALYRAMDLPLDGLLKQMEGFGRHASINRKAARLGYVEYTGPVKPFRLRPSKGQRYYVSGSQAVAYGAASSGLDLYIAYPMTPATPVLHILAALQERYGLRAVQLENEIGVVNAALGASFAGAMTMVGTSGGGYALMAETLSLQGQSELPLTVYMAMRPGPATGVPTYTSQGDLKFVLNAGHGEFSKVVVAPGDPVEAFELTAEAIYFAQKYGVLSVVLSDKHLGESQFTVASKPALRVKPRRFLARSGRSYASYRFTKDGVSPRAALGDAIVRATSYEHDEWGYTVEESDRVNAMVEKRLAKARTLEKEVSRMDTVKTYGRGDDLIVSWGSTKGAILDAMRHLRDVRFLQVRYLRPFPSKKVARHIDRADRIVVVENSATGQIADLIAESTGRVIDRKILKYDGRPFGEEELAKQLRRVFK